jgi:hypothetical protein
MNLIIQHYVKYHHIVAELPNVFVLAVYATKEMLGSLCANAPYMIL